MTPETVAAISRSLTRLRQLVRIRADMSGDDMELQQADYMRVLAKYDPRDVEAAVLHWAEVSMWWPTLQELSACVRDAQFNRESRQRAATEHRKLADVQGTTDYWSLHYTALGVGLQVLQGQILLEGLEKIDAADWFNGAVEKLGLERAKSIANEVYKPGHHGEMLPAIMAATSMERPRVRPAWVDVDRLAAKVKREHAESQCWYAEHNREHGRKLDATFQDHEQRLATGDRTGLIPDMRERSAA